MPATSRWVAQGSRSRIAQAAVAQSPGSNPGGPTTDGGSTPHFTRWDMEPTRDGDACIGPVHWHPTSLGNIEPRAGCPTLSYGPREMGAAAPSSLLATGRADRPRRRGSRGPGRPAGLGQVGGAADGVLGATVAEVAAKVLLFSVIFYVLLIRRQVSRQTLEVGQELPHQKLDPSHYFADVGDRSHRITVPAIAALVGVAGLAIALVILEPPGSGAYVWYELPIYLTLTYLRWIAFAVFVYTFGIVLWGMNEYARKPYPITSFFADPALGLGPLGRLTISLAAYYILFVALIVLYATTSGNGPLTFGVAGVLSAFGAVMFYLPLRTIHLRMLAEKNARLAKVRASILAEVQRADVEGLGPRSADPTGVLLLDVLERRVDAIRTWPFETGTAEAVLGKIVIPVGLAAAAGLLLHYAIQF